MGLVGDWNNPLIQEKVFPGFFHCHFLKWLLDEASHLLPSTNGMWGEVTWLPLRIYSEWRRHRLHCHCLHNVFQLLLSKSLNYSNMKMTALRKKKKGEYESIAAGTEIWSQEKAWLAMIWPLTDLICRALVPRTLARSYFVMYGVVVRSLWGTWSPSTGTHTSKVL